MKKPNLNKTILLLFLFISLMLFNNRIMAQEDPVVTENVVKIHYYNSNNSIQYLIVESLLKTGKKFEPHKKVPIQLFLDSNSAENLIGKVVTDDEGKAKAFLPPSLKTIWDASPKHKFIAVPDAIGKEEASPAELEITKARMTLDTTSEDGVKSLHVTVEKYEDNKWVAVKDVEMKLGVQRLGGILSAGDAATYTTDSTGKVNVEFKRDSLPGDLKGNLVLVARVDDNDQFGTLNTELNASWGIPDKVNDKFFNLRTLWTTRFRTPFWLLAIAYSIVISVWGTLIFLIFQFIKVRRIGKQIDAKSK